MKKTTFKKGKMISLCGLSASALFAGCYGGVPGALPPQSKAFIQELGRSVVTQGVISYVDESARIAANPNYGKPVQVNVNGYTQEPSTFPETNSRITYPLEISSNESKFIDREQEVFFTCNYAKDFDGNGYSFDEFIGIKNNFQSDERITLVGKINGFVGSQLELEIFNAKDELMKYRKSILKDQKAVQAYEINPKELPKGNYIAVFLMDGKFKGKSEFMISD